jgi:hypothetical protein
MMVDNYYPPSSPLINREYKVQATLVVKDVIDIVDIMIQS